MKRWVGCAIGLAAGAVQVGCGGALASPLLDDVDGGGGAGDAGVPASDASPEATAPPSACVEALGKELTAHACSHAEGGPYVDVVAGSTSGDAPSVTKIHTAYRISYRQRVAPFDGLVSYTPSHDDEFVFFADGARDVEVLDGAVETHRQAVGTCPSLTSARMYRLQQGRAYSVRIEGERRTVMLYVEHGEAFEKPFAKVCPGKHGG